MSTARRRRRPPEQAPEPEAPALPDPRRVLAALPGELSKLLPPEGPASQAHATIRALGYWLGLLRAGTAPPPRWLAEVLSQTIHAWVDKGLDHGALSAASNVGYIEGIAASGWLGCRYPTDPTAPPPVYWRN